MSLIIAVVFLVVAFVLLLRFFSADVYDVVIVWMTARWYHAVFEKVKEGERIFDVGIGTATALVKNKDLMLKKRISVVGIDYEEAYVRKAEKLLKDRDLWKQVPEGTAGYLPGEYYCRVFQKSIYDDDLHELCAVDAKGSKGEVPDNLRFDSIYFSGSLTVIPNPHDALKAVVPLMKKDTGLVYITQTFQKKSNPLIAAIKPLLKYLITIDFGQLTTEKDLDRIISDAGVFDVVENKTVPNSIDTPLQSARLIILKVKK